jgi:guanylate kinase
MSERGKVFVITGPSGVGKGTLIAKLLEAIGELELSVSATTRDPRPGEADGRDYHFLTEEEFEHRVQAGEFLEHADYSGHRYGTLREAVDGRLRDGRSVVLEIEVQGARQIREAMPEAVQIFIAPPSPEDLQERLEGRGTDSPEAIGRRLETARSELAAQSEFAHVIVNDDLQKSASDLELLVRGELSLH